MTNHTDMYRSKSLPNLFTLGRSMKNELAVPFEKSRSHPAALTTSKYGASKKKLGKAVFGVTDEAGLICTNI